MTAISKYRRIKKVMSNNPSIAIVGVGNEIRGDDGIGPYIINILINSKIFHDDQNIELYNLEQDAFAIIDIIDSFNLIIIIDCAMISKKPGSISVFDFNDIKNNQKNFRSVHGFSIIDTIKIAHVMNNKKEIKIIGIQPESIEISDSISPIILKKTPEIIQIIKNLIYHHKEHK